jgi:hypothetical protein
MSDLDELCNTETKYHIYDIFVMINNDQKFATRLGYKEPLNEREVDGVKEWAIAYFGDDVQIKYSYKRPME